MRKTVFAAVAATAALALGGCSNGDKTEEEVIEQSGDEAVVEEVEGDAKLVVWVDETREKAVQEAADAFEADTGNKVELVKKNFDDIRTDFTTQVPSGHGPDITVGAHDWVGELVDNAVVAPVELGDAIDDYEESAISAFQYDGQMYALPYAIENVALLRNVDLAPEAPANWDDVLAMGGEAGTKYQFLIQMNGEAGDPYTFYGLQTSFGSTVFKQNEDGSYTNELNLADGGAEFAQFLADNGTNGTDVFNTDREYDIVLDAFAKGESPFLVGGPWMLDTINEHDVNVAVDPIPSAGGQEARPFAGVQGFYLSAQSKNPLLATDFMVNYLGNEEIQLAMYEAGGRPPALKAAAEIAAEDPITEGFMKAGANALPMPAIPEMGEVWDPWGKTEAAIVDGKEADPAAAWEAMIADIQSKIE